MSTTEHSSHVSLSIPSEHPPPPSDNFNFMRDTFTLPQDGSTQVPHSQGYAGLILLLNLFEKLIVFFFFRKD